MAEPFHVWKDVESICVLAIITCKTWMKLHVQDTRVDNWNFEFFPPLLWFFNKWVYLWRLVDLIINTTHIMIIFVNHGRFGNGVSSPRRCTLPVPWMVDKTNTSLLSHQRTASKLPVFKGEFIWMSSPLESLAFLKVILGGIGHAAQFDRIVPQANVFCCSKSRKSFGDV